ncbi:hypothetical protein A1S_3840 [Acinetobacter baumannii ATCC 17978]|nr:hypothetical protein A1S_3840 [Acinetobacter baumannii ATCC 17978]
MFFAIDYIGCLMLNRAANFSLPLIELTANHS